MNELIRLIDGIQGTSMLDYLNPLRYISHDQYMILMKNLFNTILQGFWSKLLASASLFLAFFFGVYRQRIGAGISLYFLAIVIAYGGGLVKVLFGI